MNRRSHKQREEEVHNMNFLRVIAVCFFIIFANCDHKEEIKSKNSLPYFRRQLEEITEDGPTKTTHKDSVRSNLESFIVKNVKEIFNEGDPTEEAFSMLNLRPNIRATKPVGPITTVNPNNEEDVTPTIADEIMRYENITMMTTKFDHIFAESALSEDEAEFGDKSMLMQLSKEMKSIEKFELQDSGTTSATTPRSSYNMYTVQTQRIPGADKDPQHAEYKRSCVYCNNINHEDCSEPSNKLLPSVVCEHEDDLCYSMHTPFGIIDRGCFNVNHNLTIYVCACNLCNYMPISEMPHIFSNKRDWVDNVVEHSRVRNLRKSVLKDMSCLRCEVNTTKGDILIDSVNCLEGNIGTLPTQVCEENEICGVRALKDHGYMWRGCLTNPLYNYWWALCDSDLCNADDLISMFDIV